MGARKGQEVSIGRQSSCRQRPRPLEYKVECVFSVPRTEQVNSWGRGTWVRVLKEGIAGVSEESWDGN